MICKIFTQNDCFYTQRKTNYKPILSFISNFLLLFYFYSSIGEGHIEKKRNIGYGKNIFLRSFIVSGKVHA